MRTLSSREVDIPEPEWRPCEAEAFDLSSHARAREALDIGLAITARGFNIFVLGEDRAGRMTATVSYLRKVCRRAREHRYDWIYVFNFHDEREPLAFSLGAGDGRRFSEAVPRMVRRIKTMLNTALGSETHRERVLSLLRVVDEETAKRKEDIRIAARCYGFDLEQTQNGVRLVRMNTAAPVDETVRSGLMNSLAQMEHAIAQLRAEAEAHIQALDRQTLQTFVATETTELKRQFSTYPEICAWIDDFAADMVDNIHLLWRRDRTPAIQTRPPRYSVNLFIDRATDDGCVVLEPNPTYENLFGRMEYMRSEGSLETNLTLIRPGTLHRANGGVLVLRADDLSKDEQTWTFLKAALRDNVIRIEELHRAGAMPTTGTPRPQPIPLDAKVVIVGSADTYYRFFSLDPDFRTHFKIKADIDPDMPATKKNRDCLGQLISNMATRYGHVAEPEAVSYILGIAARWAGRRDILTARFELLEDVVSEACQYCEVLGPLTKDAVKRAWAARHHRDSRSEQRFFENLERGYIAISTQGNIVGQVNALTVRDMGDHQFGRPSRVTARAGIGDQGLMNLERITELGGKTQQKGAFIVEAYLRGVFGSHLPVSFDCSVTFEQNYGSIDGDSASVAELIAILSALSGLAVRQDFAVTGSFNQLGATQSVGDIVEKIEGFFRATRATRDTGITHGVLIPAANVPDVILEEEIVQAVEQGSFIISAITHVEEAVPFMMSGEQAMRWEDVFARTLETLTTFDRELVKRRIRI
ncbi:MAG TPA: ATP-binding protein [Dongiaceae bacterium]|nr:ATP-binding protein [Dongiaceae bacterium]